MTTDRPMTEDEQTNRLRLCSMLLSIQSKLALALAHPDLDRLDPDDGIGRAMALIANTEHGLR